MGHVTFEEYERDKIAFLHRHGDWKVYTSPMGGNKYYKTYTCEDNALFAEVTERTSEPVQVELYGLKQVVFVDVWRTEFWSTEQASQYLYELA